MQATICQYQHLAEPKNIPHPGTAGFAGSSCLLSIAGAAYIAPWTPSRRKLHAAREFTLYWKARFLLQLLGAAWAVSHSTLIEQQLL